MSTLSQVQPPIGALGRILISRRRGARFEMAAELLVRVAGLVTVVLLVGILVLLARQGVRLFVDLHYPLSRFFSYGNAITDNTTDPDQFQFGVLPPLIATFWVTLVGLLFAIPGASDLSRTLGGVVLGLLLAGATAFVIAVAFFPRRRP